MNIKILILSLLFSLKLFSGEIKILNRETKEPLKNATVHCICLDGEHKDSVVVLKPNKNGIIKSPYNNDYRIFISNMGFKTYIDTISNFSGTKEIFMVQTSVMLDEVVTTGQFAPQSVQKSVYDIKIIDEDRIDNQGANNLTQLLMTESNISFSQDGILGSSISINGVSGSNVKVLIDGVPVIGRLNGNIDMSQINLSNIEKVEIVEGPMSSIYGSDALGGVINLISKDAQCERLEFEGDTYFESIGQYNLDGTVRYSIDDFNVLLNVGRDLFQGYDKTDTSRNVQWNPKEQYFGNLQAIYNLKNHTVQFSSRYFDEFILNRGNLRPPYFESAFDDKYYTTRWVNALFLKGQISKDKYYDVTASYSYYNRIKNTFFKNMLNLEERLTTDPADQDTSVFDLVNIRATFSDDNLRTFMKYQAGMDFNYETGSGQKILNTEQEITDAAGFLSMQVIPNDDITIQPSVRLIYNSKYEAPIVPAINARVQLMDNLVLRGSYAKGFRAPSLRELYLVFVDINHNIYGNDVLKAETSDSYNLSLLFSLNDDKYYFKLEPKFFYNKIYDMITLANLEGDLYQNVNIGSFETLGGNLTMQYLREDIMLKSTFSYIGRLNSLYGTADVDKYYFSPELNVNFDYNFSFIDTKLSLFYKYTGKMPAFALVNEQVAEYYIEDYNLMDLSLSKRIINDISVVAGVKNLFDINEITSSASISGGVHSGGGSSFPVAWGRTFFFQLNFKVN